MSRRYKYGEVEQIKDTIINTVLLTRYYVTVRYVLSFFIEMLIEMLIAKR